MTTLKSVIAKNVATSLTTLYTNSTGSDAVLKAFNINHVSGYDTVTSTTGADGNGFLGNNPLFADTNQGSWNSSSSMQPNAVAIDTDKVFVVYGTGYQYPNRDYTQYVLLGQVLEYNSTTGAYTCGPIQRIPISPGNVGSNPMMFSNNGYGKNGVTKLKLVYAGSGVYKVCMLIRYSGGTDTNNVLYTININGNVISPTVYSVSLPTVFTVNYGGYDFEIVTDNTDKVLVTGGGSNEYRIQCYNVPNNANPTPAGSLQVIRSLGTTPYQTAIGLLRRSDNTYLTACGVNSTTNGISKDIITFNSSTNTINVVNSGYLTALGTVPEYGLHIVTTATGTDPYAWVVWFEASASKFCRSVQTSATVVSTSFSSSAFTNSETAYAVSTCNWGDEKAVVLGTNGQLIQFSSNGTVTNLNSSGTTYGNGYITSAFLPFSTRPVHFYASLLGSSVLWQGLTGGTATTWGSTSNTGNYVPFGIPTGRTFAWSDTAQCWFAGYGSRIYALSTAGTVLGEYSFGNQETVRTIGVSPSGRVYLCTDRWGHYPTQSEFRLPNGVTSTGASSASAVGRVTSFPVVSGSDISSMSWLNTSSTGFAYDIYFVKGYDGNDYGLFYHNHWNSPTGSAWNARITCFDGAKNAWQTTVHIPLIVPTDTTSRFSFAAFVQTKPVSETYPYGMFRLMCSNSAGHTSRVSNYISNNEFPALITSDPGGGITSFSINSDQTSSRAQNGMGVIISTNSTVTGIVLNDSLGNLLTPYTPTQCCPAVSSFLPFATPIATKSFVIVAWNNYQGDPSYINGTSPYSLSIYGEKYSYSTDTRPTLYYEIPVNTIVAAFRTGTYTWKVSGGAIDRLDTGYGAYETKAYVVINDGTNDVYITPKTGSTIYPENNYRCNDAYYLPDGYSIKVSCDGVNQADALLTILEEA